MISISENESRIKDLEAKWKEGIANPDRKVRIKQGYKVVTKFKQVEPTQDESKLTGFTCLSCGKAIELYNSFAGKIRTGMLAKTIQGSKLLNNELVETEQMLMFPKFIKGRACLDCRDKLIEEGEDV